MNKTIGIIAEYNPFHSGHAYQIEQSVAKTEANTVVAVMSGNFVQRGEPALYDKWERARQAVRQGVNLVVELPFIYACNSAEYFAFGGVKILESLGEIEYISFGSECGDIEKLKSIAKLQLEIEKDARYSQKLSQHIKTGLSYPKAKEVILRDASTEGGFAVAKNPNDVLAVEYIKKLEKIEPITIKRIGSDHHKSATEIRNSIKSQPGNTIRKIEDNYYKLVMVKILENGESSKNIFAADDGLAAKIKNECRRATDMDSLIMSVKSKAYTHSRISRLMTHLLLDFKKQEILPPSYIRVLAFDKKGSTFLSRIAKNKTNSIPIITNINKEMEKDNLLREKLKYDILATDLYNLMLERNLYEHSEFLQKPYVGDR